MFVTRMDSSLALPLCALSGCRSLRMQSLIRVLSVAALILAGSVSGVKAAGLFDGILGLFGLQASAPEVKPDPLSYGKTYCVRLCDGRYYPVASAGNATPVQMCSAMCPASKTRIFRGAEIDNAVDERGARYRDTEQAFAYRTNLVPGCTCNGKDAFGLVNMKAAEDPTLRPGDVVATDTGFVTYNGGRKHSADFTPIASSHSGLSGQWRRELSQTRITPGDTTPGNMITAPTTGGLAGDRDRRAQLDK
jgi:Protein of unknown function (DUF2865)